jgi:hypothetical protein
MGMIAPGLTPRVASVNLRSRPYPASTTSERPVDRRADHDCSGFIRDLRHSESRCYAGAVGR